MVSSLTQLLRSRLPFVDFVERVGGVGRGNKSTEGSLVSKFLLSIFIRWVQPVREKIVLNSKIYK